MMNPSHKMNPFPGLRPFTQEEDYLFFGREEQTLELLARLGNHRFVAVVGASGSGKSSLVRCGLLSELQGGKMLGAGAAWEIAVTHPGGNPLALLTEALLDADLYDRAAANSRENLLATLSRSHFGLVEAVKQAGLGGDTNFLLVVDQFEEIFRFHEAGQTQQEMANEYVSMLLEAAAQKEVPIYVVLTMRSDFIGECGQFEGLAEAVNRGEFLIPRLTREQYKRIIEGPIKVAGGQIAPRLLQRLLNDLGQQADQLPCLQHALMRTWNLWAEKGDHAELDLDDYQRVGKMTHALSLHADEIYDGLQTERQRQLCRGLFQALTVQESENRGIRRPQRLGRLCQILDVPVDVLLPIIDAYRQKGVTFLMPGQEVELTDRTIIDISHESLMRVWTRLRNWVDEEAQAAGIYLRLSESAALYDQGKAGPYRDPELGIALAWQESQRPNAAWAERYHPGFDTAMAFLAASQQAAVAEEQAREAARQRELEQAQELAESRKQRLVQQQRAAKRLRKLIAGLAVVALIAGLACAAALVARNEANRLAKVAEQEADHARQNEDKATQNAQRAERSQRETADALRLAQAAEEAGRKLLYTTDMQLAPFLWRDGRTTAEQLRALLAKHIPDQRMNDENGQRSDSSFILRPSAFQKPDLRGFEWYYYQHLLEQSATVLPGHGAPIADSVFSPNAHVVTLDENGQIRRWDRNSREEDESSRRDLPGGPNAQVRVLSPAGRLAALAEGNNVHVFDVSTGKQKFLLDSTNQFNRRLIFSRDESKLVIVDNRIRWCNAASGEVIASVDQTFGAVISLALSADGLTLAQVGGGGMDFVIRRLDPNTRMVTTLAKDLTAEGEGLGASALSPDGRLIAVGCSLAGLLFLFDTATGASIAKYGSAHASPISAIAFSGDGTKLATADVQGTIKIWTDAQKLTSQSTPLWTLKGHQGTIATIGFSIDGSRLVSGSVDKTVRIWDLENAGAAIRPLEHSRGDCWVARFSSDGQLIAAADGSSVRLWDSATGGLVRVLSAGDNSRVFSVAFSPTDSNLLATGHGGQANVSYVSLWNIHTGTEIARLPGATDLPGFQVTEYTGPVGALAFSPDGKYLVAGFGNKWMLMGVGSRNPLKVWEVATRQLVRRLNGHTGFCISLDFSRDGKLLASGSRDGTALIWSTEAWKPIHTLHNPDKGGQWAHFAMVDDVALSPVGKSLAMASRGGNVHLWDVATGKLLKTLKGHSNAVQAVAFSPDGRTLASGGSDQTVRLWNVATRRELMQLDPGSVGLGNVSTLAFSPDGKQLLTGGEHAGAALWSAAPVVWNDPDRAAEKLQLLLKSNADFQGRVRMWSENLQICRALEKLDAKDVRVQAALAATQANWNAFRQAWPEAVKAFDCLRATAGAAVPRSNPEDWLRTPGLLRLATALVHQNRPAHAAMLLHGGAKRRTEDGLPAVVSMEDEGERMNPELLVASSAFTFPPSSCILSLIAGLTREGFVNDPATGELLYPLRAALNERLAKEPRNPGLLELRAELAGQWSDARTQVADYTAAIDALSRQEAKATAADLRRLYGRRGNAHIALQQWQLAVDDYARVVTDATTDEALLANQALALANLLLTDRTPWTVLKPAERKSQGGATLSLLDDNSILASGNHPGRDVYTLTFRKLPSRVHSLRLEALTHDTLPNKGPGRHAARAFVLTTIKAELQQPKSPPLTLKFNKGWGDSEPADARPSHAIDAEDNTGWSPPECGQPHYAVYELEKPIAVPEGAILRVTLEFKHGDAQRELGRCRLSVSPDPVTVDREQKRFAVMVLTDVLTDPWQKLAAAYQLKGDQRAIDQLVERRPKSAGPVGDLFTQAPNQNWQRAVEIYNKGITAKTYDADLLSRRARAYEALKNWNAAAADWSRAANGPEGPKLLAAFARRLAAAGQVLLAKDQFEKSQATCERLLEADPQNELVATELAELLWDKQATRWVILKPANMESKAGTTLTLQSDGSILASGINPEQETCTVVAKPGLDTISAVRLETLPHPSLPKGGAGRDPNGSFYFNKFTVGMARPGGPPAQNPLPLKMRAAVVSFHRSAGGQAPIEVAVDGQTWWDAWPAVYRRQVAIFELQPNPENMAPAMLVVQLTSGAGSPSSLGCFRISVTSDPAAFDREQKRFAAMQIPDVEARLAAGYAVNGRNEAALSHFSAALQNAAGVETRKPIVELAAQFDGVLSALVQQHPGDAQLQLALARKLAERGKQHLSEKQHGKAQAELEKSRAIFTRLVAPTNNWKVLTPVEMKAETGAKMELQMDGSVFVHQDPPGKKDAYSLVFQSEMKEITGLRLEALADSRLPHGGPGWDGEGNFLLNELTLQSTPAARPDQVRSIALRNASADFSQRDWDVRGAVDGNDSTGWGIMPQVNKDHTAVFELADRVGDGQASRLTVRLNQGLPWGNFLLGRFRLSFATDATTLQATRVRLDLKDSELVDCNIALGEAFAQQGQTDEASAVLAQAFAEAPDRVGKARVIAEAARLKGVLEKLAERAAGNGPLQVELVRHFAERGQAPLADAVRNKARALFEQQLAERHDNADAAHRLADLLLIGTARWSALKPTEMSSPGGETFAVEEDGSIFVSGPDSERAVYKLNFRPDLPTLAVIRLETIPDARLPHGGAGRFPENGNFHLAEFTAAIASGKIGSLPTPVVISRAMADFPESENQISTSMIDGNPRTLWDTYLRRQEAHWALFSLKSPVRTDSGSLSITLDSGISPWGRHGLGHFRLSASDDPAAFDHEKKRDAVLKVSDPWAKLAAAYDAVGDQAAREQLVARHPSAAAGIGALCALQGDWKRALAEYDKAITSGSKDASIFAARAEAHEKLEHWELAAADWGNADLYASDKKARYGNPSRPPLEHRALIYAWHLQQFDKQVQDCTELLKPERLGDNPWIFNLRGEAYDRLRQWDKALADFDQAVKVCQPNERENFQFLRARHFAVQGQWRQAANEMRPLYQQPIDANKELWRLRDASLIFAIAGDVEYYGKVATECYRQQSAANLTVEEGRWIVLTMLLYPGTITKENRSRLLEMAGKVDPYWQPRLTAAIHFRAGDCQKAAEFFDANGPEPQFLFLAAMTYQKLGKRERARQLFAEGNSWIREQRGKDPGAGVPKQYFGWQDWVMEVALQSEASGMILGPAVGASMKLAVQGQVEEAAKAYAKELADAPDQQTKARVMEELAQFDGVLTALHQRLTDDRLVGEAYRRMVEKAAADFNRQLDALAEQTSEGLSSRSKLISVIIRRQDGVFDRLLTLRPEDRWLKAVSMVLMGDWKQAAAQYSKLIESDATADSIAWMESPSLWAYAGKTGQHRESCQKMYEHFRNSTVPNDTERCLKMMVLVESGPELPADAVKKFVASIADAKGGDRAWFRVTRALLDCRKGNYSEAHKRIDEALALEKESPYAPIKCVALAVQSLIYAHQKDVAKARKSLDQVKQVMSQDLKMTWKADGLLDGRTILNGATVEHDKLIPEILRREAEKLIRSAASSPSPKTPAK